MENKIGDDRVHPPNVGSFDIRVEVSGIGCPWLNVDPCAITAPFDLLRGGAGVSKEVPGTNPLPLPSLGQTNEYFFVITADPNDEVDESDETDNVLHTTKRVKGN